MYIIMQTVSPAKVRTAKCSAKVLGQVHLPLSTDGICRKRVSRAAGQRDYVRGTDGVNCKKTYGQYITRETGDLLNRYRGRKINREGETICQADFFRELFIR